MKIAGVVFPIMAAGVSPALAQSIDDVRLTELSLEQRYSWLLDHSAVQHFRVENLTDRALKVSIECGFETATGYADGSGDLLTIPPRRFAEGTLGGDSVTGAKIESAECTVSSVVAAP